MANYRLGRINQEIKKEISNIIENDLKDPRLNAMVSLTKVDTTNDLKRSKVFVSIFGDDDAKESTFTALENSSGFIRKELSQRLNLRNTPEIIFKIDNSIDNGMRIDRILKKIKNEDKDKEDKDKNE